MSGPDTDPTYVLEGRQALTPVFEALNQYEATTHSTGRAPWCSTASGPQARATRSRITCSPADGERKIMIESLRYLDTFVKIDDTWLFAERRPHPRLERDPAVDPVRCRARGG